MTPVGGDGRDEVRVEVDGRTLTLSNLAKVLYPRTGFTKGEVLHYYAQVAPVMLPHLRDRGVTRIRWPHGVGQASFFEKNVPRGAPTWVRTVEVPTSGTRGPSRHGETLVLPLVDDLATLTWLANLAALELHVHQWRVGDDGRPLGADRLVIDLDPGEPAGLGECCEVALDVRHALGEQGLVARPVLSGSKGLHLYADLPEPTAPDETSALAKGVADGLAKARPDLVTATMTKSRRRGRVFLDWSQNAGSKTTVAPYSLRGRERPTVAAPLTWSEVEAGAADPLAVEQLGVEEVLGRIAEHGDLLASS